MAEEGSLNRPTPPQDGWSGWWRGAIKDEHNSDGDDNFSDGSDEDMAEVTQKAGEIAENSGETPGGTSIRSKCDAKRVRKTGRATRRLATHRRTVVVQTSCATMQTRLFGTDDCAGKLVDCKRPCHICRIKT